MTLVEMVEQEVAKRVHLQDRVTPETGVDQEIDPRVEAPLEASRRPLARLTGELPCRLSHPQTHSTRFLARVVEVEVGYRPATQAHDDMSGPSSDDNHAQVDRSASESCFWQPPLDVDTLTAQCILKLRYLSRFSIGSQAARVIQAKLPSLPHHLNRGRRLVLPPVRLVSHHPGRARAVGGLDEDPVTAHLVHVLEQLLVAAYRTYRRRNRQAVLQQASVAGALVEHDGDICRMVHHLVGRTDCELSLDEPESLAEPQVPLSGRHYPAALERQPGDRPLRDVLTTLLAGRIGTERQVCPLDLPVLVGRFGRRSPAGPRRRALPARRGDRRRPPRGRWADPGSAVPPGSDGCGECQGSQLRRAGRDSAHSLTAT